MRFLAISGSLRAASSNAALLKAAAENAPEHVAIITFDGIEAIPAFNPDREGSDPAPDAVAALRVAVRASDCVVFSTPEYAHGVPGALKNALDWLVGSGEFYEKPVAFLHASARGEIARGALKEVLLTMGAKFVGDSIIEPGDRSRLANYVTAVAGDATRVLAQAQMRG